MGQKVDAKIDVFDAKVHCQIMLPGMLSLFAAPIEAMLRQKGDTLLLGTTARRADARAGLRRAPLRLASRASSRRERACAISQ